MTTSIPPAAADEAGRLAELSAKATQGEWCYRPYAYDDWGWIRAGQDRKSPLVAVAKGDDDERELSRARVQEDDPRQQKANADFICALVNDFRAGRLVPATPTQSEDALRDDLLRTIGDELENRLFGSQPRFLLFETKELEAISTALAATPLIRAGRLVPATPTQSEDAATGVPSHANDETVGPCLRALGILFKQWAAETDLDRSVRSLFETVCAVAGSTMPRAKERALELIEQSHRLVFEDAFYRGRRSAIDHPPAATQAPPAPSRDVVEAMRDACKPWEFHLGPPPPDDSPLSAVFGAGMAYTEQLLAGFLGVKNYEGGDGSENFDQDATKTLENILTKAGLYDPEDGKLAALASTQAPAEPSQGALEPGSWEAIEASETEFFAELDRRKAAEPSQGVEQAITDEMVERANRAYREAITDGDPSGGSWDNIAKHPTLKARFMRAMRAALSQSAGGR